MSPATTTWSCGPFHGHPRKSPYAAHCAMPQDCTRLILTHVAGDYWEVQTIPRPPPQVPLCRALCHAARLHTPFRRNAPTHVTNSYLGVTDHFPGHHRKSRCAGHCAMPQDCTRLSGVTPRHMSPTPTWELRTTSPATTASPVVQGILPCRKTAHAFQA
jgi:hypothetical protein